MTNDQGPMTRTNDQGPIDQRHSLIIRENFVRVYTVFSLYIRDAVAVFHIIQAQFFPLIYKGKISAGVYTIFSLNIRGSLLNSVIFYYPHIHMHTYFLSLLHILPHSPHPHYHTLPSLNHKS